MALFKDRIKELRTKNGLTQSQLAERLGFKTYTTVSKWEAGENLPRGKELKLLAEMFNVSSDYILGISDDKEIKFKSMVRIYNELHPNRQQKVYHFAEHQLEEQNKIVSMNEYIEETMYGHLSAGSGEFLDTDVKETVQIPKSILPEQHYDMVLQVNGDSMEPMFEDKEYVFVRKTEEIRSGQIAVLIINGESYLKKVYINDDHIRLVSLNKNYDDMVFDDIDDIKVVGTVVM